MDIEFDPKKTHQTSSSTVFGSRGLPNSLQSQSWRTRARTTAKSGIAPSALSALKRMRLPLRSLKKENQAAKESARSAFGRRQNKRSRIMSSRRKSDPDNPKWTRDDFARAKAPKDVLSVDVLATFGKHRGAQKAPKKVPVSIRLSPIVVTHFRDQGPGWQARIDDVLTKIVKKAKRPASTRVRKAG
jgi:uncharacterized protein (DUF4415 family)